MSRMSVFALADNEQGHVQAVIHKDHFPYFAEMGFVASVDELGKIDEVPKPEAPESEAVETRRGKKSQGNSEE